MSSMCVHLGQYLLDPGKGLTGAEVNQLHVHGGSALMEVGVRDRNIALVEVDVV